jgi:hypothetical protein
MESTFMHMKDKITILRGTIDTLVKGLQRDSATRVATPSRVVTPAEAVAEVESTAVQLQPKLVSSSNHAALMTISGMKKLMAKNVLIDYIVHNVKKYPQNLVMNVNDSERERKKIIRVINYVMTFAIDVQKAEITCQQPLKSSTTWVPWLNRLKAICETLQTRAMSALLVAERATMTPEEIKKIKQRDPYVSTKASRIGHYIDVTNQIRKGADNASEGFSKLFKKTAYSSLSTSV